MRICILGNSHTGALKLAWSKLTASVPQVELIFFAAPGIGFAHADLEGGHLVPRSKRLKELFAYTSGGLESVDIAAYDAFLVYGLGFSIPRAKIDNHRYSSAVVSATYSDLLAKSLNWRLGNFVRSVTHAPIYVGHNPVPSLGEVPAALPAADKEMSWSYDESAGIFSRILAERDMLFIAQPHVTFGEDGMTKREYSFGSLKLDVGGRDGSDVHDADDIGHMNEEFGRIWLESFFKAIAP
jgi:hypothetical protein